MASVLVVDDSAADRRLIREKLEILTADGQFWEADRASPGLVLATQHQPDFIILDWLLPGLSEANACHAFRQVAAAAVILVYTNGPTDELYKEALAAGASEVFKKGDDNGKLQARIRLGRVRQARARCSTTAEWAVCFDRLAAEGGD